jgi:hypothetical protein
MSHIFACGSSESTKSTNTSTGINTSTAVGSIVGACTITMTDGTNTITQVVCIEYTSASGGTAATIEQGCVKATNSVATASFSDRCSTTNLLGTCARSVGVTYSYSGGMATAASEQQGCTSSGGVWSNP